MCGGQGVHHLLDLVISSNVESQQTYQYVDASNSYSIDIEQQVKLMFARGEIGAEAYHRLLDMARRGDLKPDDPLAFQSYKVNISLPVQNDPPSRQEFDTARFAQLQQQRNQMEAACVETENSIRRLRLEAALLYQQAESAGIDCQEGDEQSETIQTLSRIREELLAHARSTEERIGYIEERLSNLKAHLHALVVQEKLFQPDI